MPKASTLVSHFQDIQLYLLSGSYSLHALLTSDYLLNSNTKQECAFSKGEMGVV